MQKIIAYSILCAVKMISHLFYRGKFKWITPIPKKPWDQARLMIFLNHTSLFEPLFIQALSFSFLWKMVDKANIPGADITLDRPIVGRFWKMMLPNISSITRKRDESWINYLKSIASDSLVIIAPEGRMKRPGGLDKFGKPMDVKGGVADIIETIDEGGIILCLSGGLHHVQSPGEKWPRLFKTIKMNFAYLDIKEYKKQFTNLSARERKLKIINDLQYHLEHNCPTN